MESKPKLARFRADPAKIRIEVQKFEDGWMYRVSSRPNGTPGFASSGRNPEKDILRLLEIAYKMDMPGIDLDMQWAYDHPFEREA